MRNIAEVYHEKIAELQKVMRELDSLRIAAPLLADDPVSQPEEAVANQKNQTTALP